MPATEFKFLNQNAEKITISIGVVMIAFGFFVSVTSDSKSLTSFIPSCLGLILFILGVLSPFFGALMTIYVRKLGKTDHPTTTALWYNIFGTIVFLFICLFNQTEFPKNNVLIMFLVLIGIMSSFQQFFLAYSLKMAPVSLLAPLRYISVPIGIVVGIFIFDEVISTTFFLGTVIIVFSSFLIIKRETVKKSNY